MKRALVTVGLPVWAGILVFAPVCAADPADPTADPQPAPAATAAAPQAVTVQPDSPVTDACKQFGAALNVAALNYEDFAYATAGSGNYVDYQNPEVSQSNVVGRTALRAAAATAMSAAGTPGLPPEVSNPMRAWSLRATKLLVVMGLHGGGDSLNSNATELNSDAHDVQMACVLAARGGA